MPHGPHSSASYAHRITPKAGVPPATLGSTTGGIAGGKVLAEKYWPRGSSRHSRPTLSFPTLHASCSAFLKMAGEGGREMTGAGMGQDLLVPSKGDGGWARWAQVPPLPTNSSPPTGPSSPLGFILLEAESQRGSLPHTSRQFHPLGGPHPLR